MDSRAMFGPRELRLLVSFLEIEILRFWFLGTFEGFIIANFL